MPANLDSLLKQVSDLIRLLPNTKQIEELRQALPAIDRVQAIAGLEFLPSQIRDFIGSAISKEAVAAFQALQPTTQQSEILDKPLPASSDKEALDRLAKLRPSPEQIGQLKTLIADDKQLDRTRAFVGFSPDSAEADRLQHATLTLDQVQRISEARPSAEDVQALERQLLTPEQLERMKAVLTPEQFDRVVKSKPDPAAVTELKKAVLSKEDVQRMVDAAMTPHERAVLAAGLTDTQRDQISKVLAGIDVNSLRAVEKAARDITRQLSDLPQQ